MISVLASAAPWARTVACVALICGAVVAACESRPREIDDKDRFAAGYLDNYEAIVRTMERVDDVESARLAAARITALKAEMNTFGERMTKLGAQYQKHFSRKFGARFAVLRERMVAERQRIAALPDVDAAFTEAMQTAMKGG